MFLGDGERPLEGYVVCGETSGLGEDPVKPLGTNTNTGFSTLRVSRPPSCGKGVFFTLIRSGSRRGWLGAHTKAGVTPSGKYEDELLTQERVLFFLLADFCSVEAKTTWWPVGLTAISRATGSLGLPLRSVRREPGH
jgi:hypothetical protein